MTLLRTIKLQNIAFAGWNIASVSFGMRLAMRIEISGRCAQRSEVSVIFNFLQKSDGRLDRIDGRLERIERRLKLKD